MIFWQRCNHVCVRISIVQFMPKCKNVPLVTEDSVVYCVVCGDVRFVQCDNVFLLLFCVMDRFEIPSTLS
jgi:hypothetical protein